MNFSQFLKFNFYTKFYFFLNCLPFKIVVENVFITLFLLQYIMKIYKKRSNYITIISLSNEVRDVKFEAKNGSILFILQGEKK